MQFIISKTWTNTQDLVSVAHVKEIPERLQGDLNGYGRRGGNVGHGMGNLCSVKVSCATNFLNGSL